MAFLKNLFGGKDAGFYLDKGNRLFAEGRYAEARVAYGDALEKLGSDDSTIRAEITTRRSEAGDALAVINLKEAEHCFNAGDSVKALDHLELARELAVGGEVRGRVDLLMRRLGSESPTAHLSDTPESSASCDCASGSCGTAVAFDKPPPSDTDQHLSTEERFELMTAALPDDLPRRYRAMGARFADAYLLSHDGDDEAAARILEAITTPVSQDIIFYELALIRHRQGSIRDCESLLRQAMRANDRNPLCYLALVDLSIGTGRPEEALSILDTMIALELLPAQALMVRGDILEHLGQDEKALENYVLLLDSPYKKDAAMKIIPILERLGRGDEARQLFSRYVKGCC